MDPWWKTWHEVTRLSQGRDVYLYGRSEDWLPKTLGNLQGNPPKAIIDRNPLYHGTEYDGIPVVSPEVLKDLSRGKAYFVITAGVFEGIVKILDDHGFQAGTDFACCPEFRDFHVLETMRNYEQTVYVSSSDYNDDTKARYSRAGGGIFRYRIGENTCEKILSGFIRQMVRTENNIYAVDFADRQLFVFDKDWNKLDSYPLDHPNYCGIAYCPKRKYLYLINAGEDTISVHQESDFALVDRIHFSEKYKSRRTSNHHLNDCCIIGDHLYVTYFSFSGTWKIGNYDGGVCEMHLDRLHEPATPIVKDLWMPHSPKFLDGKLCYLDSMRGKFHMSNQLPAAEFGGFVRGLAFDGRYFYVGQSEDMYISRRFGEKSTIMLNAGFYMFDAQTKANRFYPMLDTMNVHDILV